MIRLRTTFALVTLVGLVAVGALVPTASATAAPEPPNVIRGTPGWSATLNDYAWSIDLNLVEFADSVSTTTIRVIDATGQSVSTTRTYADYGSGQVSVDVPRSFQPPMSISQNDGSGWSAPTAWTYPATSMMGGPALIRPPWRLPLRPGYQIEFNAPNPGITYTFADAAGWVGVLEVTGTTPQNWTVIVPEDYAPPLRMTASFGPTQAATVTIPTENPTPTITSITGPNPSTGRWTVSGTGIPGSFVRFEGESGASSGVLPTNRTVSAGGTWTFDILPSVVLPIYLIQNDNTVVWNQAAGTFKTRTSSRYTAVTSLPGGAGLAVSAAISTTGMHSPPRAGDLITYTFTASNTGAGPLSGVEVTPVLPGLSPLTYAWPGVAGALAAGESATATATYTLTQADIDAGSVAGTVAATSAEATATSTAFSTSLTRSPALTTSASVDASGLSSPPQAGDELVYSVVMTNTGNVTLTGVDATGTPAAVGPFAFAWPGAPGHLAPGETVTGVATYAITSGDLATGSRDASITGSGQPPSGAPLSSAAATTSTDLAIEPPTIDAVTGPDASGWRLTGTGEPGATVALTPATGSPLAATVQPDGTWSAVVPVAATGPVSVTQSRGPLVSVPVTVPLPAGPSVSSLTVSASVDAGALSAPPRLGEALAFTITLVNDGDTTLSGVSAASTLPGIAFGYVWPGAAGVLTPGQTATGTATYPLDQADLDARVVVGTVTASGQNPAGDPVTAPPVTTTTPIAAVPALTVAVEADLGAVSVPPVEGDVVTFTAVLTNTGSTTLTATGVVSTLPGLSGFTVAWPGASGVLAPGQQAVGTATYSLTAADAAAFEIVAPQEVTASALAGGDLVGDTVVVVTPLGALAEPVVTTLYGPDLRGEWTIGGTGTPGAEITVTDGGGTATTTDVVGGEWDAILPSGTTAPVTVIQRLGSVSSPAVVTAVLPSTAASLDVTIDDSGVSAPIGVGDELVVGVVVANTGVVPLTGVAVSTTVPGMPFVSLTGWPGAPGVLAPGESVSATVPYALTQEDVDSGRLAGVATVAATGPQGNALAAPEAVIAETLDSVAAASILAVGRINGELASEPPGVTVAEGSTVEWTVTVTNTGTVTLHDVAADSRQPSSARAQLAVTAAVLTPPAGFSGTLAPGQSVVFRDTGVARGGTHGTVVAISSRVGSLQVAGIPVGLSAAASMYYSAAGVESPEGGNVPLRSDLAGTGLDLSAPLAIGCAILGVGLSALLLGAARRRSRR